MKRENEINYIFVPFMKINDSTANLKVIIMKYKLYFLTISSIHNEKKLWQLRFPPIKHDLLFGGVYTKHRPFQYIYYLGPFFPKKKIGAEL